MLPLHLMVDRNHAVKVSDLRAIGAEMADRRELDALKPWLSSSV